MNSENFVYWLQGALELGQQTDLTPAQVKIVQDHLNLVLKKVTPQYSIPQMPATIPGINRPFEVPKFEPGMVTC